MIDPIEIAADAVAFIAWIIYLPWYWLSEWWQRLEAPHGE